MRYSIENDWITLAGLRAICLRVDGDWRCGYVEVPADHPLFNVDYNEHSKALSSAWVAAQEGPIGKRGIIPVFCALGDPTRATPDRVLDVHGSLTFSAAGKNGYPVKSEGWWFGFDCAHAGDQTKFSVDGVFRTVEYVMQECESLANQLAELVKADAAPA